jgi:hypothetical protein
MIGSSVYVSDVYFSSTPKWSKGAQYFYLWTVIQEMLADLDQNRICDGLVRAI